MTLLPVDTLTYRGLWIEGLTSENLSEDEKRSIVAAAQELIAKEGRLNTGALIPVGDEGRLTSDVYKTATLHGEYHWWQKLLN